MSDLTMPKSKDVLLGQAEALEEFADGYEGNRYSEKELRRVQDDLRERAIELRAQAAALPDVPPDQSAVIAENEEVSFLAPKAMHPNTRGLVRRFASAMAAKLRKAEEKYGYSDGWRTADWADECRAKLREHLEKGDPVDVANYCAFLWHHGASTAIRARHK